MQYPERKNLLRQVGYWKKELRKIIHTSNIYSGASIDELDLLTDKLVSGLSDRHPQDKIKSILMNELQLNYGLDVSDEDSQSLSLEIMDWWNHR